MMRRTRSRTHLRIAFSQDRVDLTSRERCTEFADRHLAAIIAAEDTAERFGMSPHARSTCQFHQCWTHECITDAVHINPATGHRWCYRCDFPITVEINAGEVRLRCTRCGAEADSPANREVLNACRISLCAKYAGNRVALFAVPDP